MMCFNKLFLQLVHPHQGLEKVNFSPFRLPVFPSRRAAAIVYIRAVSFENEWQPPCVQYINDERL
jgi:hypothetical protein